MRYSLPELGGALSQGTFSREELHRYSRHLLLEDVGIAGQERLKGSSVLCVGAGGLGSPVLMYLAAAGVGRIGIVDFDKVDLSNLQRQILFHAGEVGLPKVEQARKRLESLNPNLTIEVFNESISRDNVLARVSEYDVVVDGTDNFPTRYLVADACEILQVPYVYGSVFKFEGQVSVFNFQGGPAYRDLYPNPPVPGSVPSCGEAGVLGVLPGVIGVLQATETLKILLGKGTTLSGRLLMYDALSMGFHEIRIRKDPNRSPVTSLHEVEGFCEAQEQTRSSKGGDMYTKLSVEELKSRREEGWSPYVLDVRWEHEAEIATLPFVDRLHPHDQVQAIASELPRDREIVVTCRSGGRSARACMVLAQLGFTQLYNLEGGILAWSARIDPSIPQY